MNQSSAIAAGLIVAFIVFVTVRGELPCYMQVLGIATDAACPVGNPGGTAGPVAGGAGFRAGSGGGSPTVGGCVNVNGATVCGNSGGGIGVTLPPVTIGGGGGYGGFGF